MLISVFISPSDIIISGHARYAEKGKDIVCSAVSVLVFNFINSIEVMTEDVVEYQVNCSGHINIQLKNLSEIGKLLKDSLVNGLGMITNAYPMHVQMTCIDANETKTCD